MSAAFLGLGLRTSPGNSLAWCSPQTTTHYWPSMWVAMKFVTCSPRVIKRCFKALAQLVRESGVWVIFSALLPVVGSGTRRNRQTQSINTWLYGWGVTTSQRVFYNVMALHGTRFTSIRWNSHLSQRGKRVFPHEPAGLIDRTLN